MKKFWIALFFLVLTCLSINIPAIKTNARTEELVTNCKAAYLCDFHSGTVLYKQNEEQHLPIASMCKIMTLLLCFEAKENGLSFDKEITVSKNASSMGGSQVFLAADKKYKIAELVKSITIASANDSCVAMAEEVAGSEESFIQKMNARAKELGMYNTVFVNCTGLPKDGQYSCAKDVSIMLRELLKHKDYYTFSSIWMQDFKHEGDRVTQMANTNKLIRHYQGCDAGKTGYTAQAGFCLVPIVLFVPVKGVDLRHFRIGQLEAVQFGVLLDMIGIAGTGDDHHALLEIPAKNYLGGGYPVGLGNAGDHLISQQLRRMATAPQGIPALDHDPKVLDIGDHIILLIVGVDFILNQSRSNRHLG